jgi:tetratricopeptide (TPR) repeat protein
LAKISLRDYLNGIEELIDNGRTEEALAHCRHILELFPKNIATYQMMGKAYLESHQHTQASDIFQRVLSSSPDDFVSHIGMSIIREEAADLDGAIWNMERAFEAQPSNRAVQEELRRLYGKREGYAPPKVRLTRGALARMYAHGDLYNQAIGELRAALAEDPNRPDLQVLLAEMYYRTKRETEAIEICTKLIEKLPYCLYANRLMVDILNANQREFEAKPYLDRVEELDPYAALVDTRTSAETALAEAVMLEQLVYEQPIENDQSMPRTWTGSLELESSAYEKEELPDWLSVESIGQDEKSETETPKQSSGLLETLEGLEPTPTSELGLPKVKSPSAALSDDQVPDWLRELRPSATSALAAEQKNNAVEMAPQDHGSEMPQDSSAAFLTPDMPAEEPDAEPATQTSPEDDEGLEWLEKLAAQQGAPEEELITSPEARESAKPEWLPEEKREATSDALAWLDDMAKADSQEPVEPISAAPLEIPPEPVSPFADEESEPTAGTTPTWLKELSAEVVNEAPTAESEGEEVTPRPLEEAPDWLNELRPTTDEIKRAQEAAEEESLPVQPEEINPSPLEAAPDWLKELRPSTDEIKHAQEAAETESAPAETEGPIPSEDSGKLDWLEELGQPKSAPVEPVKGEWLPEMPAVKEPDATSQTAPVPLVSPRKTAALLAEQEAPGRLEQARQALNYGKLNEAADQYGYLLHRRLMIKDVIADLDAAVHRHPGDATLWQTLGDAYMRNNQLREALDCYTRAEDLL